MFVSVWTQVGPKFAFGRTVQCIREVTLPQDEFLAQWAIIGKHQNPSEISGQDFTLSLLGLLDCLDLLGRAEPDEFNRRRFVCLCLLPITRSCFDAAPARGCPLRDKRDYHEFLTGTLQHSRRLGRHRDLRLCTHLSCELSFCVWHNVRRKDLNVLESRTKGGRWKTPSGFTLPGDGDAGRSCGGLDKGSGSVLGRLPVFMNAFLSSGRITPKPPNWLPRCYFRGLGTRKCSQKRISPESSATLKLSERASGCSCVGDGLQLTNHPEQPPSRYIAMLAAVA